MIDKVLGVLSNIAQAVKSVLKSTYSIFKRILLNPITIALLIGGVFFLLWKWLGPKLSGGIEGIKNTVIPVITSFASKALGFIQGVGSILFSVGKFLFKAIDWLTNPKGILARFIVSAIKLFLAFKKGLKALMKATGRSNIDILCMFLAGDMIGIALHAISGAVKLAWDFIRKMKFMLLIQGLIKTILAVGKLIFSMHTIVLRTIMGALWQMVKGNFGGVVDAITKPWKDIWQQIKDLFSGKTFKEEVAANPYMMSNPVEDNSEQAKNASISVRSLKMKGQAESNLAYFNKLQGMMGQAQYGDLLPRIQKMNELYQENAKQVGAYEEFIGKTWELGKVGDDAAQQILKHMLESPEVSQKLLSVFFLYNPQTGETQMLRPLPYITQFLDNIR